MKDMLPIPDASNYLISRDGFIYSKIKNRWLKAHPHTVGYRQSYIMFDDGKSKWIKLHRAVALTYIPNPENKPDVNHKDGDKENNHVDNLEWMTRKENIKHGYDTGLIVSKKGKEHHRYGKSASVEAKAKMSIAKQGERHPDFKGWYVTPLGRFTSTYKAAEAHDTYPKKIYRNCKEKDMRDKGWFYEPL